MQGQSFKASLNRKSNSSCGVDQTKRNTRHFFQTTRRNQSKNRQKQATRMFPSTEQMENLMGPRVYSTSRTQLIVQATAERRLRVRPVGNSV